MAYQISVIIPIYNVDQYIEDCLNSIVHQSIGINKIEVLLIDDYSTDRSMNIAEKYANRYESIKLIRHPHNLGTGSARNTGLSMATTELIAFLDADDFISSNTFELAIKGIQHFNVDLFIYEYEYYSPSNKVYPRNPSAQLFSNNKVITNILDFPELIFSTSVCNKVFKRAIIEKLRFSQSRIEDVLFSTRSTFHASKIYISNECNYYYRKREENNSKTDDYFSHKESYLDHLNVNTEMHQLIEEYPHYKDLIDWFNARSLHPFVYSMQYKPFFSLKEKRSYFSRSKKILSNIEVHVINQLEKSSSQTIVKALQEYSFSRFAWTSFLIFIAGQVQKWSSKLRKIYKFGLLAGCWALSLCYRFNKEYSNVWLVCERGDDAGDNGYSFFKFLCVSHPEINAFYLMDDSNQANLKKVQSIGRVVPYGGIRHKILFILAKYLVTAHRGTIEPWNYQKIRKHKILVSKKQKYIFLQHGVTKDDVSNVLGREHTSFDLFITGAKPEYEYIVSTFGYDKEEVVYTGFARFDDLYSNQTKKQILFMPTWRKKLAWSDSMKKADRFKESEYFRRYQSLLNNEELNDLLVSNGYKLIFYPHHEMQQFINYYSTSSESIVIADKDTFDVQALLKESVLLLTDYSSVFFDFGYMDKPIVYYQFDQADFFESHYKRGYFNYEMDGFGPVLNEEQMVVNYIKASIDSNFKLEGKYSERIERFFPLKDQKNCERIFQSILQLK